MMIEYQHSQLIAVPYRGGGVISTNTMTAIMHVTKASSFIIRKTLLRIIYI